MIETNARGRDKAAGGAARRERARPAVRRADPGPHAEPDPRAEADPRAGPDHRADPGSAPPSVLAPAAAPDGAERLRAARYLDLWERHVSGAAHGGRGIAAPWFSR